MSLTRRRFLVTSSTLAATAVSGLRAIAQQPTASQQQTPAPTAFRLLRRNVGIFTGAGGTIGYLQSPGHVVVVDSGMPPNASVCLDRLIGLYSSLQPVDYLFNTHHHGDHTGGNGVFRPRTKQIVAHVRVPELQKSTAKPGTEANQVYADTTFADRFNIAVGDETVHASYVGPAHTGGDSVVFFARANIVHVGDLVFNRRQPVTDRPGGCSLVGWIKTLERVVSEHDTDTLFIFGHAKQNFDIVGGKADLLYQRDFLSGVLDHVRTQIKAGKAREEIVKASVELKGFADHGPLAERVLTAAYEELGTASQ